MKKKAFESASLQMLFPLITNDGRELSEYLSIAGANELPRGVAQTLAITGHERSELVTQTLKCV